MPKWNKVVGALIFLLTAGCLVISIFMTRQSGISAAATAEGKQLVGWASVIIHLGMPIFGIASGAFKSKGLKGIGRGCTVLVFLCALFSVNNVLSFVAAERTSLARTQSAADKERKERQQAALKAVDERQKTINKMAQDQIAFLRTETKHADGRREKNDARDSGTKFIQEFAKTEIVVPNVQEPAVKESVTVQAEDGAKMLSEWTGWSVSMLQLGTTLQTVLMLIIFEAFGWTIASYLWFLETIAPATATATAMALAAAPPLTATKTKLLSGPKDKVITIRTEPTADWRKLLNKIDFPPPGARHKGDERPRLEPEVQALRFMTWLGSYDERGRRHNTEVEALYYEFLNADHRKETAVRQVKSALESINRGKFASKKAVPGEGTVWNLDPPPIQRMKLLLQKARIIEPEPEAGQSDPEPDTEPEADPSESKLLGFPLWRTRQAGGQVH